ncbi:uncharacterized protein TNCV_4919881 [Trichonephila clavipes]|nr:uncharacterized protein TNCV_4919881 [Trichonephila clavipes]
MSWLLYQLMYNPACLVVPGGAWIGSCIAERVALPRPLLVADSRASPAKLVLCKSKGILLLLSKKKFQISQNKKKIQNASFKTPNPPSPTHLTQPVNIEQISLSTRFLIVSLPNNMSVKSPFAIQKALIGIGGEPKSVKRLRSGDLLIETTSSLQTKSFRLAKSFLNSPVTVSPHKSLNSCRGVISEPDLLGTSVSEILEGFSDQGVTQVRRITIKKDSTIVPTKHLILTFNSPKLPNTIKAGYLNSKIHPYIPNPLRCFKCQRFGHSQTSCRGQFTCSRCASVGHSSTDCTLEPKCVNCTQSHPSDSKLCQKWKLEKQIQELKTNRNISYFERSPQINSSSVNTNV